MQDVGYEYSPIITRDVLKWPGEARVAFTVLVAVEYFEFDLPFSGGFGPAVGRAPDVYNYSWRDYGPRVGIWRIMDTLDKYGIKAGVGLNSATCDHYPIIIEEAKKRGWEFIAHGVTNSKHLVGLPEEEERSVIKSVTQRITDAVGNRPEGWISPGLAETLNTRDILAEEGYRYVYEWCNDDQPYLMKTRRGRLVSVPYSVEINDLPAFLFFHMTTQEFYERVREQFDVLYEEGKTNGRVMSIALHPFISGAPFRIKCLDRILQYVTRHRDVWFTTQSGIVNWCDEHYFRVSNQQGTESKHRP